MSRPSLNWIWRTRDGQAIKLKDMKRSHVQNTLNWVLRQKDEELSAAQFYSIPGNRRQRKDSHTWDEWADALFQRLLDIDLP